MPRILHFIPCLSPLIDLLTGRLSILFVIENIQPHLLQVTEDTPPELQSARYVLPPFMISIDWWRESDDESDVEFVQRIVCTTPDDRQVPLGPDTTFRMTTPYHRIMHQTGPITTRMAGIFWLVLQWRRADAEEWQEAFRYPLVVEERPAPADTLTGPG